VAGKLYIVPTPIGNLEDITLRAIRILKEVDAILAEDTRQSQKLLAHLGISKPLIAYHKFNERKSEENLIQRIKSGQTLALVSDGGTPVVSDPGHVIIQSCLAEGIAVECLPGPTAFVPALVNSGISAESFVFEGFLPHKKGRETQMKKIATEPRTIILYESPYRIVKLLEEIIKFCGENRKVSLSRELSKFYEETVRGTAKEALEHFKIKDPKGEFVVVIEGASRFQEPTEE
jgi:16S rRNA (cytidine1402-2'-O)-methyltransferase